MSNDDSSFQQLCVAAARRELESQWCADVISTYKEGDRLIVEMTFAAYIAWLMQLAFIQVLSSHETADAIGSVISDFSTQPWYQADVFRKIAENVSERMPKEFSPRGMNIVPLVECGASACGSILNHTSDLRLMLNFDFCGADFVIRMKELASKHLQAS
jgi:hypothetical protein